MSDLYTSPFQMGTLSAKFIGRHTQKGWILTNVSWHISVILPLPQRVQLCRLNYIFYTSTARQYFACGK